MKNNIYLAAILLLAQTGAAVAGTALSQLPAGNGPVPVPAPSAAVKADSVWLNFNVSRNDRSGFSLNDFAQRIQVSGYKDFDGNMRFSGMAGDENIYGTFGKNYGDQGFTFEMNGIKLQVKRSFINYKVSGSAPGAGGVIVPVNMIVNGQIRGNDYMLSDAGLKLTTSADSITGTLEPGSRDKKFVAAMAALMASLQSDDIFCVVERAYNAPNPFPQGNGTTLAYKLMQPVDYVKITVYDAYGKVMTELNGGTAKGDYQVFWDGRGDYSGGQTAHKIFFWQMEIQFRGDADKIVKQFRMDAR